MMPREAAISQRKLAHQFKRASHHVLPRTTFGFIQLRDDTRYRPLLRVMNFARYVFIFTDDLLMRVIS